MAPLPTSPKAPLHELHLKPDASSPIFGGNALRIKRYKRIPSTNTKAKTLAEKGAANWTVVTAESQTQGRGRSGRTWESPKGGLWFSLIIRPTITVDRIPLLQLWVANTLRTAIEEVYGVRTDLKWPNDLIIDWHKLAGILIETKISGPDLDYAVVGVGLNVNLTLKELPTGASSILLVRKKRFSLEKTLEPILTILVEHYETLRDEKAVVADWWRHCAHRSKQVAIDTGTERVHGKCLAVNADGSIIIQTDHGDVTVSDGILRLDA